MHTQGFWGLLAAEEGVHGGGGGRGRCPKLCSLVHRSATSCAPSPALRLLSTALHKDAATNCALLQHHVQWCSEHCGAWDVATLRGTLPPCQLLHCTSPTSPVGCTSCLWNVPRRSSSLATVPSKLYELQGRVFISLLSGLCPGCGISGCN